MLAKVGSVANVGLETVEVEVEVDVASAGFPGFTIVGLPSKAVEEARERVKTAIVNSGLDFPPKKITVNLAPADLPKDGVAYDLPIAAGILAASGQIPSPEGIFYGELSLEGSVRPTRGVLLVALFAQKSQRAGERESKSIFVPVESANEAEVVEEIVVYPVGNLRGLVDHLNGVEVIETLRHSVPDRVETEAAAEFDLAEVAGQELAKRAVVIAASGGHNLLMWGPPGAGKTMLARSLPGILPPLSDAEALEVTRIYSVSGLLESGEGLRRQRPFRNPHHGISAVGMIGGGSHPQPGEVSLAHLGVLFLDEMAEFPRSVLEALRQPIEDGVVAIVRAAAHVSYPAAFTLVAAVNPCPCGYLGHPRRECRCTPHQILKYRRRISGPILDRIDLHVHVPAVETEKLAPNSEVLVPNSKTLREKVVAARQIQRQRFKKEGGLPAGRQVYTNAQMKNKQVKKYCQLDGETTRLLKLAVEKLDLSARSYFRLIKVARTIADLAAATDIRVAHMAEALQYKQLI